MDPPSARILTTKRGFIHRYLQPEGITRILHRNGVFHHNEALRITSEELVANQIAQFIDTMGTKNGPSMEELLKALQRTKQLKIHRALVRDQRTARLQQQASDVNILRSPSLLAESEKALLNKRPKTTKSILKKSWSASTRPSSCGGRIQTSSNRNIKDSPVTSMRCDVVTCRRPEIVSNQAERRRGYSSNDIQTISTAIDGMRINDEDTTGVMTTTSGYDVITRPDARLHPAHVPCLLVFGYYDNKGFHPDVLAVGADLVIHHLGFLSDDTAPANSSMAATEHRRSVYVSGLGIRKNQIWSFDLDTGLKKFAGFLRKDGRIGHNMVTIGDTIFILGGTVNGQPEPSVEGYDVLSSSSIKKGELVEPVSNAACTTRGNSIFVYGGYQNHLFAGNYVQNYDAVTNQCTLLRPLASTAAYLKPYQWGRYTFLLGSHHCFIYDTETQVCTRQSSYHTDDVQVGLLAIESDDDVDFVICGGRDPYSNQSSKIRSTCLSHIAMDKRYGWQTPKMTLPHPMRFTNAQISTTIATTLLR